MNNFDLRFCCIVIGRSPVPKLSHTDKPVTAADDVEHRLLLHLKKLEELRSLSHSFNCHWYR
jgi:hypothetical protein